MREECQNCAESDAKCQKITQPQLLTKKAKISGTLWQRRNIIYRSSQITVSHKISSL